MKLQITVVDVFWVRIYLHVKVQVISNDPSFVPEKEEIKFFGADRDGKAHIRFDVTEVEGNVYTLKVNVANNGENRCVPQGAYRIMATDKDNKFIGEAVTGEEIVGKMDDFSRQFVYGKLKSSYNVRPFIGPDVDKISFLIRFINSGQKDLEFPKNSPFLKKLVNDLKVCYFSKKSVCRRAYKLFSFMYKGKRKNTILFLTEVSPELKSNLKAVHDRMIERGMDKEYNIITSSRVVRLDSSISKWISTIKKAASSGTIFVDDHVPFLDSVKMTSDTKIIQLWHAGAGFKSSGYSRWGQIGPPGPQSAHRQYRYGIAGSKKIAPFFSEVWGINDEQVIATGMPRMDEYLDADYRKAATEKIYEQFPICKGKKVILFAPTYRGTGTSDAHYPYHFIDMDRLYELCGDEYVVIFKMHPWVLKDIQIDDKYKDKFVSGLKYPNINDMFYITDLLITDYSSSIFEYSLMRKPMLFFAFDKTLYAASRGFHRDYEEAAPGKVCYTFDEVLKAIETKDFEFEKVEAYIEESFDFFDSGATDRVIDYFINGKLPESYTKAIKEKKARMKEMNSLNFSKYIKQFDEDETSLI